MASTHTVAAAALTVAAAGAEEAIQPLLLQERWQGHAWLAGQLGWRWAHGQRTRRRLGDRWGSRQQGMVGGAALPAASACPASTHQQQAVVTRQLRVASSLGHLAARPEPGGPRLLPGCDWRGVLCVGVATPGRCGGWRELWEWLSLAATCVWQRLQGKTGEQRLPTRTGEQCRKQRCWLAKAQDPAGGPADWRPQMKDFGDASAGIPTLGACM